MLNHSSTHIHTIESRPRFDNMPLRGHTYAPPLPIDKGARSAEEVAIGSNRYEAEAIGKRR